MTSADIKIPDQPSCVTINRTVVPKGPLNPSQSKKYIALYEKNEDANIASIHCSRNFHKKIQRIYNK